MERLLKPLITIITLYLCFCCHAFAAASQSSWGEWSGWTACSKTCGGGVQTRIRTWNYAPDDPRQSQGQYTKTDLLGCNTGRECPVNGAWSMWGIWQECSVGCGGGMRQRRRDCNAPAPKHNGTDCKGEKFDKAPCNEDTCPLTPMNFNMSQCKKGESFTCRNKLMCVPIQQRCDGTAHCSDGTDEVSCRRPGYKIGRVHFSNASSQHKSSCLVALTTALVSFWFLKMVSGVPSSDQWSSSSSTV